MTNADQQPNVDGPDPQGAPGPDATDAASEATDASQPDVEFLPSEDSEPDVVVADDAPEFVTPVPREELEMQLAETQVALSLAEAQRDEHLGDLQRKAAELSNVLKREQRNAGLGRTEGRNEVLRSLLDVCDDIDRTMEAVAKSEDEALRGGVNLVHDKLAKVMASHGLVRIGEVDEAFDPNRHDAVQQIEAEDGPLDEQLVAEVYRPGYLVGDRVLRPAMVVVKQ
ncbi:MAG: molecular chaperone GrpE [Glaciecola sp.]